MSGLRFQIRNNIVSNREKMSQPYTALEESQPRRKLPHAVLLVLVIVVLCLVSGAFYHSFNLWTADGKDRSRIHAQEQRYRVVRDNSLQAGRVVDIHQQQQDMVDMLRDQVAQFEFNDSTPVVDPLLLRFETYNNTIMSANETCNARVNQLTAIVTQLINGTNSTPSTIMTGFCDFSGVVNETTTVGFTHNLITIGGLDFYFYQFSQVGDNTTNEIEVGTTGARIENCVPPIFVAGDTSGTVFRTQVAALQGSPLTAEDYVSTMTVRDGGLDFVPIPTASDPTQTLGWMGTISVFVSFF